MKKILIKTKVQEAYLLEDGIQIRRFKISTAKNGLGCQEGSMCTPLGKHVIAEKIGEKHPMGAVFRSRVFTGEVWSPDIANPLSQSTDDLVLTRVLWLEGCEEHNLNTRGRYVYLHGTNQERLLGAPVSHGCIRLSNQDIVVLFDLVDVGTEVYIE
jgi:lipoprotein-anchoring transpeptidase ErfK/SrfK